MNDLILKSAETEIKVKEKLFSWWTGVSLRVIALWTL
jgi:hypothetical protein